MITHVFTLVSPRVRPWSAAATIESGAAGVAAAAADVFAAGVVSVEGAEADPDGRQAATQAAASTAAPKLIRTSDIP
jgi:hypothetical protein